MSERRYVQMWLFAVFLLLAFVVSLNFAVDPYRLRAVDSVGDEQLLRPDVYSFVRLNKAFNLARSRADIVLLGSSRVQWGFEREAPPFRGRRPFNLALSGPRFDEVWATFRCMLDHGAPRIVVVGLDFTAFNMRSAAETQPFRCDHSLWRALATYMSSTALTTSLAAIRSTLSDKEAASRNSRQVLDAQGFSRSRSRFEPRLRSDGHHALFRSVEDAYMPGYANFALTGENGESLFADFRAMLKQAKTSGIELRLFIQPEHARQLELVRAAGLWPAYEEWKRILTGIVEEENRDSPVSIELWDFGNYDSITTEPLPLRGDLQSRMRYFTDLSHYTPLVGQYILARLLGDEENGLEIPDGFGHRLTLANLDTRLDQVRRAQAAYRAAHPRDIDELERRMTENRTRTSAAVARP